MNINSRLPVFYKSIVCECKIKPNLETPYISCTKNTTTVLTGCGSWAAAGSAIFTALYPPQPAPPSLLIVPSPLPLCPGSYKSPPAVVHFSKPSYYLAICFPPQHIFLQAYIMLWRAKVDKHEVCSPYDGGLPIIPATQRCIFHISFQPLCLPHIPLFTWTLLIPT